MIELKRSTGKVPGKNAFYGLEYRQVTVKKEMYDQLLALKTQTGLPMTSLVTKAIEEFLKQVTVIDL